MRYQTTFRRYEMKYLLTREQKAAVLDAIAPHMELDRYGRTTIRNIYFDTATFRLIRRSIEHPAYKEKLRLRSYCTAGAEDPIFVELKKKYQSVVYKRRLVLPQRDAMESLCSGAPLPIRSQIAQEIDCFRTYYEELMPAVFLSYEREAYDMRDGGDFRVTFDENVLSRRHDFSFDCNIDGTPLLDAGTTLMEIKTPGGIPLWLVRCMTRYTIRRMSFSKYGTAYQQTIRPAWRGGILYA